MKALFGWLARTGFLYLLLCVAIGFFILIWPRIAAQFEPGNLGEDTMSVAQIRETIADERTELQHDLARREESIRSMGAEAVDARLAEARQRRDTLQAQADRGGGLLDSLRPSRVLAMQRAKLAKAALDAEIAALESARDARLARSALAEARDRFTPYRRIPTQEAIRQSYRLCDVSRTRLEEFGELEPLEQQARDLFFRQRQELEAERDRRCAAADGRKARREAGIAARETLADAERRLEQARDWTMAPLPDDTAQISDTTLRDVLVRAAWALLAILLLPFAIRALLYYAIAPIAQRRRAIRIAITDEASTAVPLAGNASRASIPVELAAGEELLVRQGYLQSSPIDARLRSRIMLDWRRPFASLASGMTLLTRVRGDGSTTVISADDDPFAEVASIVLPQGAAIVLQPRALAAVAQPIAAPLRITGHWRLFSLNAWLTQQLRFLVFHGPCRLIVKGGRGVRIEPASSGRRFAQDQLVGFSAELSYSVSRNETFLPYLLGREPLLRDRVEHGNGMLVLEEAPHAGRRKGLRGGLEGAFDAFLKAFGI